MSQRLAHSHCQTEGQCSRSMALCALNTLACGQLHFGDGPCPHMKGLTSMRPNIMMRGSHTNVPNCMRMQARPKRGDKMHLFVVVGLLCCEGLSP